MEERGVLLTNGLALPLSTIRQAILYEIEEIQGYQFPVRVGQRVG